jgi:histidinol-phosphatase
MSTTTPAHDPAALRPRLEFAVRAAREAGRLTLDWFNTSALAVERKGDGSPVTAADRTAEQRLRDLISCEFPDDGILGEEFGEAAGTTPYRWILDPIDGTKSFVHGVPLYGTLVAVEDLRTGEAVVGVIEMPALGSSGERVYAARGLGAFHAVNDAAPTPARVSAVERLADAMFVTTSLDYFAATGTAPVMAAMHRACASSRGWSDCYGHVLIATGRAEVGTECVVKPWDVAATQVIVEEAGGAFSDWSGTRTIHAPRIVVSNGRVHAETIAITRTADAAL